MPEVLVGRGTQQPADQSSKRAQWSAVVLQAVALLILSVVVARTAPSGVERQVFLAVNELPGVLSVVLVPLMQAGGLLAGPVAAAIAAMAHRRQLAIELLCAGLLGWFLSRALKLLVLRPRPSLLVEDALVRGGEIAGFGYPSGHVTVVTALAIVAAAELSTRWRIPLWTLVALVAVGRLFVGAHLPLDVIGAMLLGGVIGAGLRLLFDRPRTRNLFIDPGQ